MRVPMPPESSIETGFTKGLLWRDMSHSVQPRRLYD